MWQHGLLFAACSTMGVSAPEPMIIGSAFLKKIRLATYQRHCRCSQSQLRVKGEQLVGIWALCETFSHWTNFPKRLQIQEETEGGGNVKDCYTDKIKQPAERTCSITRHRNQNFGMSSNFLRRGKPSKFSPERWEEVWSESVCLTWCVHKEMLPLATVGKIIWIGVKGTSAPHTSRHSLLSLLEQGCQINTKQPSFLFLITNYFRKALMALFELSQSSEEKTERWK